MTLVDRVVGTISTWRRDRSRIRFLHSEFVNGAQLAASLDTNTPCAVATCLDGTVIRHPADRVGLAKMILEIWHEQVYTGTFYSPSDGDVVVDAGANIGLFSLQLARLNPRCRVLAFEPFPENFGLLRQNVAHLSDTVQALAAALSGRSGFGQMTDGGSRSQDHRLAGDSAASATRIVSLEDVLEMSNGQRIALFKCDIEGSEFDLFQTAADEHLARIDRFAIEYHDNIRPGALDLLQRRLSPTHDLEVKPSPGGYGMLYATPRA